MGSGNSNGGVTVVKKNDFNLISLNMDSLKKEIKALDPHFMTSTIVSIS